MPVFRAVRCVLGFAVVAGSAPKETAPSESMASARADLRVSWWKYESAVRAADAARSGANLLPLLLG